MKLMKYKFFEKETNDMILLILYRITSHIQVGKSLPTIVLEKFHKYYESYRIRLEGDPDNLFLKYDRIIRIEYIGIWVSKIEFRASMKKNMTKRF